MMTRPGVNFTFGGGGEVSAMTVRALDWYSTGYTAVVLFIL